jgi:hypothetical protein
MMHLLIRRGLARRTDRFYKKPKPGRKRLTKWPRKLQPLPPHEQVPLENLNLSSCGGCYCAPTADGAPHRKPSQVCWRQESQQCCSYDLLSRLASDDRNRPNGIFNCRGGRRTAFTHGRTTCPPRRGC